ncbi:MAG: hypothetical protein AB1798_02380 [Spirochaetota bacterium]
MSLQRKHAIDEGRCMIRVRYIDTHEPATIGVCPGCWNIRDRREVLLIKLKKMGLEIVFKGDTLDGNYNPNKEHAPRCPYRKIATDPWKRFKNAMKKAR